MTRGRQRSQVQSLQQTTPAEKVTQMERQEAHFDSKNESMLKETEQRLQGTSNEAQYSEQLK